MQSSVRAHAFGRPWGPAGPAATSRRALCKPVQVLAVAQSEPSCLSSEIRNCDRQEVSVTKARRQQEPVLRARIKAHTAPLTAALVVVDAPGLAEFATASLDKTLATWRIESADGAPAVIAAQRSEVAGAPVFSLTLAEGVGSAGGSSSSNGGGAPPVWCGLAAKEIGLWQPGSAALSDMVRMNGHTGWVRALATSGRYLFSCGCNHLRQWDTTYTVPKEVTDRSLFTGDILAIAASPSRVFTAGADGSVRAWAVGSKRDAALGAPSPSGGASGGSGGNGSGSSGAGGSPAREGELRELAAREKAHEGRVTALVVAGRTLFSVSYDGRIKGWDVDSLALVVERGGAHGGARIQCAALGGDGLLYTGGDDGLVRRWDPVELEPLGAPLDAHGGASVRVLAAGRPGGGCLVSGDAGGEVAVWAV